MSRKKAVALRGDPPAPVKPILTRVMESVMTLIDGLNLYTPITRGALGTGNSLTCEVAPSNPDTVFLDKNQYIILDVTINGKHDDLEILTNAMNKIHEDLTWMTNYPSDTDWRITDICTMTEPQIIGREDDGKWIQASALLVKVETIKTR